MLPLTAQSLTTDGYVTIPGWISGAAVERVRSHVADVKRYAIGRPRCARGPSNELIALRWDDAIVSDILGEDAAIEALGRASDAASVRWISGYVSSIPPTSLPLPWHQDWWCWDHPVSQEALPAQIGVLCYLSAVDENSGALRVMPGSHVRRTRLHDYLVPLDDELVYDPYHPMFGDAGLTLAGRAGDAVVFDYRVLHGATSNRSDLARDAVLLSFTPNWGRHSVRAADQAAWR